MSCSFLMSSLFIIAFCLGAALANLSTPLPGLQLGQLVSNPGGVTPNSNGISPVSLADDG